MIEDNDRWEKGIVMNDENDQKCNILEFAYFILFVTTEETELVFYHIIGVDVDPTQDMIDTFMEEVVTDEEFGIQHLKGKLKTIVMTREKFEPLWKDMNDEGE